MKNNWVREFTDSNINIFLGFMATCIAILAFAIQEMILLSISFLIVLLLGLNYVYLRIISKELTTLNETYILKLFPGDVDVLPFTFENKGILPIIKAEWGFSVYDPGESTRIDSFDRLSHSYRFVHSPFFIAGKSRRKFETNLTGLKRGTAEVRDLEIVIYDLLGLSRVRLSYVGFYGMELVTYPSLIEVPLQKRTLRQEQDVAPTNFSLFEDALLPRGSREYSTEDPFHKINWKDSARLQQLQTKVYDKVTLSQWTFIVNLRSESYMHPMITNVEEVLSQIAYLSQLAYKNQISFEIYFNLLVLNSTYGMHIQPGSGDRHLTTVFETLARIPKSALTMNSDIVLSVVRKNLKKGSTRITLGKLELSNEKCIP